MRRSWTDEEYEQVRADMRAGVPPMETAKRFGVTRSCISGLRDRIRSRAALASPGGRSRQVVPARHRKKPKRIEPSQAPFAPDDSCPDFAHDGLHCGEVLGLGGFPVMPQRAA